MREHLDDCSHGAAGEKMKKNEVPAAQERKAPKKEESDEEREKRRVILRKVVVRGEANLKLSKFKREHRMKTGLDGSLVGEGWTVEAVEGRAGRPYRGNSLPRGRNTLRDPTAKMQHAMRREERERQEESDAMQQEDWDEGEEGETTTSGSGPLTIEASYVCDLCNQGLRSLTAALYHRTRAKKRCTRSLRFNVASSANVQAEVAAQAEPDANQTPARYPRANFRKAAMPAPIDVDSGEAAQKVAATPKVATAFKRRPHKRKVEATTTPQAFTMLHHFQKRCAPSPASTPPPPAKAHLPETECSSDLEAEFDELEP